MQRRVLKVWDSALKEGCKVLLVKHVIQTMRLQWLLTYGPRRYVPWKMNARMDDINVTLLLIRSVLIHQRVIDVTAKRGIATLLNLAPVCQSVPRVVCMAAAFFPNNVCVTLVTLQITALSSVIVITMANA